MRGIKVEYVRLMSAAVLGVALLTPPPAGASGESDPLRGQSFSICGVLIEQDACVALESFQGDVFLVENLGEFGVGRRVFVEGLLEQDNASLCPGVTLPAITANTIEGCFQTFGVLNQRSNGCWEVLSDEGEALLLESAGGFDPGDYVFVAGRRNDSSTLCPGGMAPGVEGAVVLDAFAGCGVLLQGPQDCLVFEASTSDSFFVENSGGFQAGDSVYVRGVVEANSDVCDPFISTALRRNVIGSCLSACGRIVETEDGCLAFEISSTLEVVALENDAGFPVGSRVRVNGAVASPTVLCDAALTRGVTSNIVRDECPGDLDGDNRVGPSDLAVLLSAWGPGASPADFDGDGEVDAADLSVLLTNWTVGE